MSAFPPRFREDARIIIEHYGCDEREQQLMREAAQADPEGAAACFSELADEISPEHGVTWRIRDRKNVA